MVVGASLAGARAADALRRQGFAGTLDLVGAEKHPPYERPPLSKQILAGVWEFERASVDLPEDFEASWHLGRTATCVDLPSRTVALDDGSALEFDGLVIATGATPRALPGTAGLSNVFTLRTIEDALSLRSAAESAEHVVVIGGGFIGSEVAATLATREVRVTIVDPLDSLMGRVLGDDFGPYFGGLHSGRGVSLRLGVGVVSLESSPDGAVSCCLLSDGSRLACDVVVVGIGVTPATEWLAGSGVALDPADGSVLCDATCAVLGENGAVLEGIVAAGDVARWDHPLFGRPVRVEHWENAVAMGEAAALRLMAVPGAETGYLDVPLFWSDQFGKKIQFVGLRSPGDEVLLVEGSTEEGKFLAVYSRDGVLTGALGVGRPARIIALRNLIAERAPVEAVYSERS